MLLSVSARIRNRFPNENLSMLEYSSQQILSYNFKITKETLIAQYWKST